MSITSIDDMNILDTPEWDQRHPVWIAIRNAIKNSGNAFFQHIEINHISPRNDYWDFKITNVDHPSTMGLKVKNTTGNVSIYFTDGDDALRQEQIEEFRKKLVDAGFSPDREEKEWTRDAMTLKIDRNKDISFAIFYPGGMDDTARAQWQIRQLIVLSQLVSELYH